MEIILFVIVLVVLILVHEIGHFIVAKLSKMRVDEFGIGFPPRALILGKKGDTEYTLNWLPFGGFVRIFGEDPEEGAADPRAFTSRPRILQALVLVAGVVMNVLLAYVLICSALVMGTQQELSTPAQLAASKDAVIIFADVKSGSPAARAGFLPNDEILSATTTLPGIQINYSGDNPIALATLISQDTTGAPMKFLVKRAGKQIHLTATPAQHVVPSDPTRFGLGVDIAVVGTVKTPLAQAPQQALIYSWNILKGTVAGLYGFLKGIVLLKPDLSQVAGPVGIANAVGQASANGFAALFLLSAIISLNLAIINLIPIPALDGGRLLFVAIEAVIRRPINPKIAMRVNAVGFILLIFLMLAVTAHDIFNLFA